MSSDGKRVSFPRTLTGAELLIALRTVGDEDIRFDYKEEIRRTDDGAQYMSGTASENAAYNLLVETETGECWIDPFVPYDAIIVRHHEWRDGRVVYAVEGDQDAAYHEVIDQFCQDLNDAILDRVIAATLWPKSLLICGICERMAEYWDGPGDAKRCIDLDHPRSSLVTVEVTPIEPRF